MILGAQSVTRRRYAAGSRGSDGRWTNGANTDSTIQASVQPMTSRELQRLPEGERERDPRKLYAPTATLRPVSQSAGTGADRVSWDSGSTWYEVVQVDPWPRLLAHDEARVLRLQESG